MNILPINSTNNTVFSSKLRVPDAEIKIFGDIDGYAEYMIDSVYGRILRQANAYSRKVVTFAQKGDSLFVNSGVITSKVNLRDGAPRDFFKKIASNIQANSEAERTDLKKGFSKLI